MSKFFSAHLLIMVLSKHISGVTLNHYLADISFPILYNYNKASVDTLCKTLSTVMLSQCFAENFKLNDVDASEN